ncbi:clavesin-1-like [Melitaea cinxia]|uniref:clavesin-1-like n=1 Tax=Melitaea cinxia TaxID=113334 RepID=UPI001E2738F1|nr:clavesin-1-like [Melitaea cinxia]
MTGKDSLTVEQQSLEVEYKKTGINPSDIAALRRWLKTQPHLPEKYITDLDLILIYFCCYKSSAVSKEVLDLHYTLKTLFTNIFHNRVVDERIIKTLNVVLVVPLPIRSYDNNHVVYHKLIDCDTKNFIFSDVIRVVLMLMDLRQFEDGTWPGFIILIDLSGVTLGHIAKLDLLTVQQLLYYLQEAMLVKLKGLHFMNAPSYVDKLLMVIKPFMKKELLNTLCIHQVGSNTLEKVLPLEALPKDAGGQYKTFEEAKNYAIEKALANKDFFENENKKRVVESLRPGKPRTITDIFGGVEGSFKKLEID